MKTYKTARGLNNALNKVLGEPSKATEKGTMTDGHLIFPIEKDKRYRVIFIEDGYPREMEADEKLTLKVDFGADISQTFMFERYPTIADITLEVSK
ncbi:hypothetical protein BC7_00062 [Bacillus phage BC-7]|nr:hypothetical protein BC7_00062 [Bacillus phage BC-7]